MRVLAIDPGRAKCGAAIVQKENGSVLYRAVFSLSDLISALPLLIEQFTPERVLIGDGTCTQAFRAQIAGVLPDALAVQTVPEHRTSERARARFVKENRPSGLLQRLLPKGLRTPPGPYDDYVAVILAEDYFAALAEQEGR